MKGTEGDLLTNRAGPEQPGFPGGCLSLTPREKQLCPNLLISVGGSSVPCNRDELGPKSSSCVNLPSCSFGPALSQRRLFLLAAGVGSPWIRKPLLAGEESSGLAPLGSGKPLLAEGSSGLGETPPGR